MNLIWVSWTKFEFWFHWFSITNIHQLPRSLSLPNYKKLHMTWSRMIKIYVGQTNKFSKNIFSFYYTPTQHGYIGIMNAMLYVYMNVKIFLYDETWITSVCIHYEVGFVGDEDCVLWKFKSFIQHFHLCHDIFYALAHIKMRKIGLIRLIWSWILWICIGLKSYNSS